MTAADQSAARPLDRGLLYSVAASVAVAVMAVAGVVLDNVGEVFLEDAGRAFVAAVLIAIVVPFGAFRFGGVWRLLGYAFPVALFCFFKFIGFLSLAELAGLRKDAAIYGGVAIMAAVILGAMLSFRRRGARLAAFAAFVTSAAALASVAGYGVGALKRGPDFEPTLARLTAAPAMSAADPATLPDIIYIVPDRYGSGRAFEAEFGVDRDEFAGALRSRGFYVADDAYSNYAKTFQSLASSMNMTLLDDLVAVMGPAHQSREPIFRMIEDSAALKSLRALGYSYVHVGSWWETTRRNRNADANFYGLANAWSRFNEFERALLRTTPFAQFATYGGWVDRDECKRLKAQFDYLKSARKKSEKPLFLFAHLMIPHDPVTMDKAGRCIEHIYYPGSGVGYDEYKKAYADYVRRLNDELLGVFDANRGAADERDLIFVIQADEGPYPKRLHENGDLDMFAFNDSEIRLKFGIVNALYWNAQEYGPPHLTRTPVNNWRIILSAIGAADLPLIEDERAYLFRDKQHIYELKDVTEILAPSARPLHAAAD